MIKKITIKIITVSPAITSLFAALLLLGSCAQVKQTDYGEINSLGERRPLEVYYQNGKNDEVDSLKINTDSTRWLVRKLGWFGLVEHVRSVSSPTSNIHKIVAANHFLKGFTGGLIGIGIGIGIGVAIAPGSGNSGSLLTAAYGILGFLLGMILGIIVGSNAKWFETEYIINAEHQ